MKISNTKLSVFSLILLSIMAFGCGASKMQRGAAIGAGAGATVGALIGKTAGNTALGTIIGGAVGGTAGAYIGHKMDYTMLGSKPEVTGASVTRQDEGYSVRFDSGIMFDKGNNELTAASQANLKNLAATLRKDPQTKVTIIGYTDTLGDKDYNNNLSKRRAEAVKICLVADSVAEKRISVKGKGGADPIADNKTPEGREKNRRVEIILTTNDKEKVQADNK